MNDFWMFLKTAHLRIKERQFNVPSCQNYYQLIIYQFIEHSEF